MVAARQESLRPSRYWLSPSPPCIRLVLRLLGYLYQSSGRAAPVSQATRHLNLLNARQQR